MCLKARGKWKGARHIQMPSPAYKDTLFKLYHVNHFRIVLRPGYQGSLDKLMIMLAPPALDRAQEALNQLGL